jgi:hypothetical protein
MADITPGLNTLDDDEKPVATGAAVKATGKGLSPVGTIAMDPTQTEELLANMQGMVDQRTGAFNTFMSGLQRASAWGSGGERGPAAALAQLDQQKLAEDKELFNMRQQMAALRSSAAQQKAFNERKQAELTGGAPTGGAGGTGAPGGASMRQSVFDQMPAEIKRALSNARTQEEWNSIYNPYAQKIAQIQAQFKYNPATYENKIKFVDPRTGKLDYIDAETAKRYKEEGYGNNVIMPTPQARPRPTGGISPEAIKQVESGGVPGLVSSAGAEGTMQVMPNTQRDPGFGVTPAKDNSQAELERVGRDYYAAMQKKYGDDNLAAIAYNMGPGKTDTWLAKGGEFNQLPKETQEYIGRVNLANAKINRAQAQVAVPQTQAGTRERVTIPEAEEKIAGRKARAESAATTAGKYIGGAEATVREAGNTSAERLSSLDYLDGLISNPKTSRVFGVFEHPNFASAIGKIVDQGIKLGRLGDVGVDLAPIVRSVMKDASQEEIDAVQKATREFAKIKLNEAKILLAGQGAVSDAERGLVQELSGSVKNSPGALRDYLAWGKMRAEYDRNVGEAYKTYRRQNRGTTFEDFLDSGTADDIRDAYDQKLADFAKKTGIDMNKPRTEPSPNQSQKPATTSPFTYKDADKEKRYQLYLQQRGPK